MNALKQWQDLIAQTLRPRPSRDLRSWTDQNIILPPKESSGRSSFDHTYQPATAWTWETFFDPACKEAYFLKPPQYGMSIRVLILLVWIILNDPKNFLYIIDSKEQAKDLVNLRFLPLLKRCRQYRSRHFREENDDKGGRLIDFGEMYLYLTGSYSPGDISSKPFDVVVLDELEKHPRAPGGESSTVDLGRDRVKNSRNPFLLGFSSLRDYPDGQESQLVKNWALGTQEKYQIPCPKCHTPFQWEFELLRHDHCKGKDGAYDLKALLHETLLECPHCHKTIPETQKPYLLPHGKFTPTNQNPDPGIRSAEISDLYSRSPNVTWGHLVIRSLRAQKDPVARQAFYLTNLVKPMTHAQLSAHVGGYALTPFHLRRLTLPHKRGQLPPLLDPALITLNIDTQDDFLKWTITAFNARGACFVIDYDITRDLARLDDIFLRTYTTATGQQRPIDLALIDEGGHRSMEIRRFCIDRRPLFTPCKGRSSDQIRKTIQEMHHGVDGRELLVYWFDAWAFQRDLYQKRLRRHIDRHDQRAWEATQHDLQQQNPHHTLQPYPKNLPDPEFDEPPIYFPQDSDDKFLKEFCSEWWDPETRHWERDLGTPNDFGDTLKIALLAWSLTARHLQNQTEPTPNPTPELADRLKTTEPNMQIQTTKSKS
jgi:phage terminase large subunit GpA-like protein